jgi:hypothetical protein
VSRIVFASAVRIGVKGSVRAYVQDDPALGLCACLGIRVRYFFEMSAVYEIETAVSKLSREELSAFRNWFSEFDAAAWDKQFEADVAAGHLDALADEALRDLHAGRCTDL